MKRVGMFLGIGLVALALSGCKVRLAMHDQPRFEALEGTSFYADQRSARMPVEGTLARGHLQLDPHLYAGKVDGKPATTYPFPVTDTVVQRGRERFNIYCAVCHGRVGDGNGMIVLRGFKQPPSFHTDRLREIPHGYFFDVITHGTGAMYDYAMQVKPEDRWAIIAYIRALQRSQHGRLEDIPQSERTALETNHHPQHANP
jgi:mono/diheme cytochrome c family protein